MGTGGLSRQLLNLAQAEVTVSPCSPDMALLHAGGGLHGAAAERGSCS